MVNIAETIFEVVAECVSSLATNLVSGASAIFLTADGDLTTLAIVILSFVGISIGFTVVSWILSLVKLK